MYSSYNAKDCSVIVNDVYITGLAEEFWSFEKAEAFAENSVGAMGDVVRSEINNPIYNATVTIQQTSPQANFLFALAKVKEPFPVWMINSKLGRKEGGAKALITEAPSDVYGTSAGDLDFKFDIYDGDIVTE